MMRRCIVICIFFTAAIFPQEIDSLNISFFLTAGLNNNTVLSRGENNSTFKSDPSLGGGIEFFIHKNERGNNFGFGIELQTDNLISGINGNYGNIPLYFFYDISLGENLSLYVPKLSLKLGYNILSASKSFGEETPKNDLLGEESKTTNGLYYALGPIYSTK